MFDFKLSPFEKKKNHHRAISSPNLNEIFGLSRGSWMMEASLEADDGTEPYCNTYRRTLQNVLYESRKVKEKTEA